MYNIYTPADIERITEATLGTLANYDTLDDVDRRRLLERRGAFIENVGERVAAEVLKLMPDPRTRIIVFAGDGICGAYALAAATELSCNGCRVGVVLFNIGGQLLIPDTIAQRDRFVSVAGSTYLEEIINPGLNFEMPRIGRSDIVIDGIFGSEYRRPLRGGYQAVARYINEHRPRVVAIDVPSGMTTDMAVGMINRNIVHADLTLTLIGPTLSFFMPENAELIGRWKVLEVPFDKAACDATRVTARLIDDDAVYNAMYKRAATDSKADLGHALIFAGSYGMLGAAVLATRAATRSGCGKVTCHGPRCGFFVMQTAVPSAMFATDGADFDIQKFENPHDADAIAIGPGIGRSDATARALEIFLKSCYSLQKPLVLDADALNIIAKYPAMLDYIPPRSVLTPHAGEFDRLFGTQNSGGTRTLMAMDMAERYRTVIVLKGSPTITVWPDRSVLVNTGATNALATAGSGDVLTGIIAGLIAQHMQPEVAAVAAVHIHGVAGRIAAETNGVYGTTAEDIADATGPAIQHILNRRSKRTKQS